MRLFSFIVLSCFCLIISGCGHEVDGITGYSVGGIVSGLTGTVVLQNNGKDTISISGNGPFSFPTKLEFGSHYSVTVLSSPENHKVSVNNASGNIILGSVGSVRVVCKGGRWSYPTSFADNVSPDDQETSYPRIAMDNNGDAIITWSQSDGNNTQIFKSEYRSGVWTNPSSLTDFISLNGYSANNERVAMDNNGNAIITWAQDDGNVFRVYMSEYRSNRWSHPTSVGDYISPDGEYSFASNTAMDDNGNAIIVWEQFDGTNTRILKSEYRSGHWIHPTSIADSISPAGQPASLAQVAMDNNGNAVIAWYQYDGASYQIFKSDYRGGAWVNPTSLGDNISPDNYDADAARVAMDNNGNAVIIWNQYDGSNYRIMKSEYRGGVWVHPSSMNASISTFGQDAFIPTLAMDNNGNTIISWFQSNGFDVSVFKSEYRGGVWVNPSTFADGIGPVGYYSDYPEVAMDDNGNAVITWSLYDGYESCIVKSEYREGVWTHPTSPDDSLSLAGQTGGFPEVGMSNSGNAIITWYQLDGDYDQIFKSEYR